MRIVTIKEIVKPKDVQVSISELIEEFEEYELLNVKYETRNYELVVEFEYGTPAFEIGDAVKLNDRGRKDAHPDYLLRVNGAIVTEIIRDQVKIEGFKYYIPKKWLMYDKD